MIHGDHQGEGIAHVWSWKWTIWSDSECETEWKGADYMNILNAEDVGIIFPQTLFTEWCGHVTEQLDGLLWAGEVLFTRPPVVGLL